MYHRKNLPAHTEVKIDGLDKPALLHNGGMLITAADGQRVSIAAKFHYKSHTLKYDFYLQNFTLHFCV